MNYNDDRLLLSLHPLSSEISIRVNTTHLAYRSTTAYRCFTLSNPVGSAQCLHSWIG